MKVLSVASECAPLVKTGGLADVVGALPVALAGQGVEMRVLLPGYDRVMRQLGETREVLGFDHLFGAEARVLMCEAGGVPLFVLDAPHLYRRPGTIYLTEEGHDWPDNPERFAALCRAAAEIARGRVEEWKPDILHAHDWQGGLAPYYLKAEGTAVRSILTVHNIAFHGPAPADRLGRLGINPADYTPEGVEFWGRISALKGGLVYADKITTVSPTYARELTTEAFGMGLDGLIRHRADDLVGILNGIDETAWNPATAPAAIRYSTPRGKAKATRAVRAALGLPPSNGPLAVVISRLTEQKGLDLILDGLPDFLDAGGQVALLGAGQRELEGAWRAVAEAHPGVVVELGYDEALSHRLIAGGDAILVPSRFEPCGLTQLYGLRYGTIPVVARTGGLADTVIDANEAALRSGVATGIVHDAGSGRAVAEALRRLVCLFADKANWQAMMRNAMRHPVGWETSAARYAELYRSVVTAT